MVQSSGGTCVFSDHSCVQIMTLQRWSLSLSVCVSVLWWSEPPELAPSQQLRGRGGPRCQAGPHCGKQPVCYCTRSELLMTHLFMRLLK